MAELNTDNYCGRRHGVRLWLSSSHRLHVLYDTNVEEEERR